MGFNLSGFIFNRNIKEEITDFEKDYLLVFSQPEIVSFDTVISERTYEKINYADFYYTEKGTLVFIYEGNHSLFSNCRFSKRGGFIEFSINETSMVFTFQYYKSGQLVGVHWFEYIHNKLVDKDRTNRPFLRYNPEEDVTMGLFSKLTLEFIGESFKEIDNSAQSYRYNIIKRITPT
jgi:hypothetical protein